MDATNGDESERPLCPSARPEMAGAVIFGVVGGTAPAPRVAHLVQPLPVTQELLALAEPASPLQVFRTAAPCAASACAHFAQNRCRLASRIVEELPQAVDGLPACRIRPDCRWWQQEGREACLRCPLVVTEMVNPSEQLRHATDPAIYAADNAA
ncbi:MAG: nitrogen fixation protein [Dehalococcoidia bacterium]